MYGTVKIGSETVGMKASAFSPYIFKQIFREDFLMKLQDKNPEPDLFQKMGYVMAKEAEIDKLQDLMKLNIDGYYEWLMQFEPMDVLAATGAISSIYLGQTEKSSVPKEEGE